MAFMRPAVYHGAVYLIDGPNGVDLVPADVASCSVEPGQTLTEDDDGFSAALRALADYCESGATEIECRVLFYGRYSAPGYMDCTDWHWADTEAELLEVLHDMYGDAE